MTERGIEDTQKSIGDDVWAIQQLKAQYCRYIDTKQWDLLSTLFTEDTIFEGFGSAPDGVNVKQFVSGVSKRLEKAISIHHCHMPEFIFHENGNVKGVWAMQDFLQWPEPITLRETSEATGFVGYGHYEEMYRLDKGQWRICFMRLTRLRLDPLPTQTAWPQSDGLRRASSEWLRESE